MKLAEVLVVMVPEDERSLSHINYINSDERSLLGHEAGSPQRSCAEVA
jgi:hypothetical protein